MVITLFNSNDFNCSAFPQVKIAIRSNYEDVRISNISPDAEHYIQLKHEKLGWKVVHHQMPRYVNSAFEKAINLQESVRTYIRLLDNLQPFYMSLQVLDDICVVGEPKAITTKTNWRLVKYSNKIFIKVEFINPMNIDEASITFHGCTNSVKEMTEMYNSNCEDYEDENIYNKLLKVFGIPYFPASDEDCIDCSICLSYRCENNRCPIICCDNDKCDSTFHISCLDNYLKVKKHQKILSVCISECPFCKSALSNSYAPFFKKILAENNQETTDE